MPRWRQVFNEETGKSEFIPIGDGHSRVAAPAVHGDIQPFVSPVDGTLITDRKQLREHNKRNNVVSASEFDDSHYKRRAEEKQRLLNGEHTREEKFARKQELYNQLIRAERNGN